MCGLTALSMRPRRRLAEGPGELPREQPRVLDGRYVRASRAGSLLSLTTVPTKEDHMAVMTERPADNTAIRPFTIGIPEGDLEDLRARIAATRWPEKETVDDAAQGVQLATMQALARY